MAIILSNTEGEFSDFVLEEKRANYLSFANSRNWPHSKEIAVQLANSTFEYTGQSDEIRCTNCGTTYKNLSNENIGDVIIIHERNCFPRTVTSRRNGDNYYERGNGSEELSCPPRNREPDSTLGALRKHSPKHENYRTYESRLATFTKWPKNSPLKPEALAAAGMFYLGVDDHTKCFQCGAGLCQWAEGDDPWLEHTRWFPDCPFVQLGKGKSFVQEVSNVQAQVKQGGLQRDCVISQNRPMLDNLKPYKDNLKDIIEFYRTKGISDSLIDQAIKKVLKEKSEVSENTFQAMLSRLTTVNHLDEFKKYISNKKPEHNEAKETLPEEVLCKVCFEEERTVAMLPCGHVSTCVQCSSALDTCPICRNRIQGYIRVYLS